MSEKFYYSVLRKLKIDTWGKVYTIYWVSAGLICISLYFFDILDDIARLVLFVLFFIFYGAFVGVGKISKSLGYAFFFAFIGLIFWFIYTFYL
tara:strand:+ start:286 stop:564 length:279 start_codon:yes stop_codon:yes gene_type:complete